MHFTTHNLRGFGTPLDGFVYYPVDVDYIREDIKLLANETVREVNSPNNGRMTSETEENIKILIDGLSKKWLEDFELWNQKRINDGGVLLISTTINQPVFDERMIGLLYPNIVTIFGYQFKPERGVIVNPPIADNLSTHDSLLALKSKGYIREYSITVNALSFSGFIPINSKDFDLKKFFDRTVSADKSISEQDVSGDSKQVTKKIRIRKNTSNYKPKVVLNDSE